jgi:hypothetical protein
MHKYIYVIRLEHGKRFIYCSEDKLQTQIFSECAIYYDYVKKYKPLDLEDKIPMMNYIDLDTHVKWYMHLYGISNVRGGSYFEDQLPEYLEKAVKYEFNWIEQTTLEHAKPFLEILEKYEYRKFNSIEEIDFEISKINEECKKYKFEKERLKRMIFFTENETIHDITSDSFNDMLWLYQLCCLRTFQYESKILQRDNCQYIDKNLKSIEVKKYRKIRACLNHLFRVFDEFDLFSKHSVEKTVELKYPQFVFDTFIFHSPLINKLDDVNELCNKFKLMREVVCNIITEYEFDISNYGSSFEWQAPRILYILEKKKAEREREKMNIQSNR